MSWGSMTDMGGFNGLFREHRATRFSGVANGLGFLDPMSRWIWCFSWCVTRTIVVS